MSNNMDSTTNNPVTQQSFSSSSETNKKRNNNRRRNNNNKKPAANTTTDASSSSATTGNEKKKKDATTEDKRKNNTNKKAKEPLKGFKKVSKEESKEVDEDEDAEVCFICTRPIDYYAAAPCDHRTCHLCTLRLRVLYNTRNCSYCKDEAKRVVFTSDSEKPYESYSREDTPFYDKKYGIRFETEEMYKDTMILLQHNCPEQDCERAFENWAELKAHIKEEHQRLLCDFCIRNKKIFAHEHTLYTRDQLQKHYREGDASFNKDDETGFTGHPECVFCKTRFYGADELFEHCRDKHEQCHLCVRRGIQHQYYANYDNLEKHFKKEHFLCMYKECLDNKFVVFESDIDLKAHEVNEHGNALSRQQRAKQSEARRVDVNLNYSSNGQQRNGSNGGSRSRRQQPISLSAEDFPDINGSTTPLLSSRLASVQLSEQEQWPTLGDDSATSGRSSPSASESDTGIVSRHAAALDRIADIFKNFDKVVKFRQLTTGFTNLTTVAETFVDSVYDLCGQDADLTAKILNGAKDLVDNRTLKSEMVRSWNQKKNPSSGNDTPRVLVVNPPNLSSSNGRRGATAKNQNKKAGVWDKVASAAVDAGATRSSTVFPPVQSKTPWSGTSTPRTASESDLQQLFPALPSAGPSRRADINSMIKKNTNAWGESAGVNNNNTITTTTDSEYSDIDTTNRKKKGKKGKQILFRVGL